MRLKRLLPLFPVTFPFLGLFGILAALACGCAASRTQGGPGSDPGMSPNPGGPGTTGGSEPSDPVTCADAEQSRSYVGCDYWPTITPNSTVNWVYDFAVVVSNTSALGTPAVVTVTGPAGFSHMVTVPAQQLVPIYLPWVVELKHNDSTNKPTTGYELVSQLVPASAYHLVSSSPVVVYQFNALEAKGEGGAPGKDWSNCEKPGDPRNGVPPSHCWSYSNDASLLLPSTALTGNYRVTGWLTRSGGGNFISITGLSDNTSVAVRMSALGRVNPGPGVAGIPRGQTQTYKINRGDVLQLISRDLPRETSEPGYVFDYPGHANDYNPAGSLIQADQPVEVITGANCLQYQYRACDHVEQTVFPAEALGRRYLVAQPSGPRGGPVGQGVHLIGNVNGTHLTFNPPLTGAPATLDAGQVFQLGKSDSRFFEKLPVETDFEVTGDHAFTVVTMQDGSLRVDSGVSSSEARGDPSFSQVLPVEQFRRSYLFLAPSDYEVNFVDVTGKSGTVLTLDGQAVSEPEVPIGSTGYSVTRVPLQPDSSGGAHVLIASDPVGIQVMGYAPATSYQYPGGANLVRIAPPPIW